MPVDLNDLRNAARGAPPASQAPEAARSPRERSRPRAVPSPAPVVPPEEGYRFRWWHLLLLLLVARGIYVNFIADPKPDASTEATADATDEAASALPADRPSRSRAQSAAPREPAAVTARVRNQWQTEIRAAIADSDFKTARDLLAEYRTRYPQDPETPVLEARLNALRAEIAARAVSEAPMPVAPAAVPSPTPAASSKAQMESQSLNPLLLEVEGAREP
jgi:hypothetical protein